MQQEPVKSKIWKELEEMFGLSQFREMGRINSEDPNKQTFFIQSDRYKYIINITENKIIGYVIFMPFLFDKYKCTPHKIGEGWPYIKGHILAKEGLYLLEA